MYIKLKNPRGNIIVNALAIFLLTFSSCKCKKEKNIYENLAKEISAYHTASFQDFAEKKHGNPKLFIDFSDGISEAYNAANGGRNSKLIQDVYNSISGSLDVFQLDNDSIKPLSVSDNALIGRRVVDATNYHGKYAPISDAVKKIVGLHNDAILVTDFEDFYPASSGRNEILNVACFKDAFIKWLSKGNSIQFFVSDFQEKAVNKHLYFTVFTYGSKTPSGLLSKVEPALKSLKRFDLNPAPYQLRTDYAGRKTAGVFYDANGKTEKTKNVLDMQQENYVTGRPENIPFEFYQFGVDWKTISESHKKYQEANQFNDFFRHLFIDLSQKDVYQIKNLEVRVYDVTKDYEHFAKYREALAHKPVIEKGSNGEDRFSKKGNDELSLNYYQSNGQIKPEWIYRPGDPAELKELFTLNQVLFDNTQKTDLSKTEIGTAFHPNFNFKNIPVVPVLTRVDIIVRGAELQTESSNLDLFKWQSLTKPGQTNEALYQSLLNTIKDEQVLPKNKVIYTYYIKTANQN